MTLGAAIRRISAAQSPLDDVFLEMIERWREMLADDIARHNDITDDESLTAAVQRIIDRIVFLRIRIIHIAIIGNIW